MWPKNEARARRGWTLEYCRGVKHGTKGGAYREGSGAFIHQFFLQSILILRKEGINLSFIFTVVCFCIHYYFHHDHADFHCCFKEGQPPWMGYWE